MKLIFCVKQLTEKYRAKKKNVTIVSTDLEKAYDRVFRQVY